MDKVFEHIKEWLIEEELKSKTESEADRFRERHTRVYGSLRYLLEKLENGKEFLNFLDNYIKEGVKND